MVILDAYIIEGIFYRSKCHEEVNNMQTITITITSSNPTNIVVRERKTKRQNIVDKLAELFNELDPHKKVVANLANER